MSGNGSYDNLKSTIAHLLCAHVDLRLRILQKKERLVYNKSARETLRL
jgi:hypothetical protein